MLYSAPRTVLHHLANMGGALFVGLFFAFVGLNAASGCGQAGGQCIAVKDLLHTPPAAEQLAQHYEGHAG